MKIKRPNFMQLYEDFKNEDYKIYDWFDENVEPINKILSEGVEVYGYHDQEVHGTAFSTKDLTVHHADKYKKTHKALLINIQPINEDSAEDVLRDMYDELSCDMRVGHLEIFERALAVLQRINK